MRPPYCFRPLRRLLELNGTLEEQGQRNQACNGTDHENARHVCRIVHAFHSLAHSGGGCAIDARARRNKVIGDDFKRTSRATGKLQGQLC